MRINCLREAFGLADVQAILETETPPPALMLPKVRTPEEVAWLDDLLTERGHNTRLHVIIETNRGLQSAFEIAHSSSRIDALFFGGVDMAAELRCQNAWEPLLYARSRVVHAAASAGVDVIDVPYLDLEDPQGMEREAQLAKALGFSGKGSVHPKQIATLNSVFTPTESEIARARKIIKTFEEADTGFSGYRWKTDRKTLSCEICIVSWLLQTVSQVREQPYPRLLNPPLFALREISAFFNPYSIPPGQLDL